jgi:transcriptional regulator with XRE-family HTH domain
MSDLAKLLGRRIYEFRKQNRLTQAALAERARISNEFMSAIERGMKLPSLAALQRIAEGLRVDVKDLFNFDRTAYKRLNSLSREVLDAASVLQELPVDERRRLMRVVKLFMRPKHRS